MTKSKKKTLIIITIVLAVIILAVGTINIVYAIIGGQKQQGKATGYELSKNDAFETSKIQSIDIGKNDFKILVLTDIHFKNSGSFGSFIGINYILDWAGEAAIKKLVKENDPNLILILGDSVLTKRNDIETKRLVKLMDGFKIPWASVFGNHDQEGRADKAKLCDVLLESEYGMFEYGAKDLHGAGNYVINLTRGNNIAYSLYMMDSGSCVVADDEGNLKEDSINKNQIAWYEWNTNGINTLNNKVVPNMAFFHIPLQQYALAESFEKGNRGEKCCVQYKEFGFFESFKKNGGTHTFVGHDHTNNFTADIDGIKLNYAMKSSYNCNFKSGRTGGTMITLDKNNQVSSELVFF